MITSCYKKTMSERHFTDTIEVCSSVTHGKDKFLESNPTEKMKSLDIQSKTPNGIPNRELRFAIFSLPVWWFIIFVAVSTRAAHFLNDRSLPNSELAI